MSISEQCGAEQIRHLVAGSAHRRTKFAERMRASCNPAGWAIERVRVELDHDADAAFLRAFLADLVAAFDEVSGGEQS